MNKMRYSLLAAILLVTSGIYADSFTIEPFTIDAGKSTTVKLRLDGSRRYIIAQADIFLPDGVTISGMEFISSMGDHSVTYNQHDGGYTFIIESSKNSEFLSNSGDILNITLSASDQLDSKAYSLQLKNQELVNAEFEGNNPEDLSVSFNVAIPAAIGKGGYGSFSWPRDVDFSKTDVEVYVGTSYNNGWLHLESVDDKKVPAGTGVMLKGKANETVHPQTTSAVVPDLTLTNLLKGTATEAVASDGTLYALATKTAGTGLYKVAQDVVIPKYKAYLSLGGSEGGAREAVFFGSETDGIQAVDVDASSAVAYDLQGRRVDSPAKGIYVKDGRKIIVK